MVIRYWRFFFSLSVLYSVPCLYAQDMPDLDQDLKKYQGYESEHPRRAPSEEEMMDKDLKELQKEIETGAAESVVETQKVKKWDFYRFFGKHISIRADEKYVYIKAGPTSVVLDADGRLQIRGQENILISTEKDLHFKAGRNIYLQAGEKVHHQVGKDPSSIK